MTAKTVSEMLTDFIDDEAAREDIENEIQSQRLSTILFSRISVKDLEDYSSTLGIDVVIRFQRSMTAVAKGKPSFRVEGPG